MKPLTHDIRQEPAADLSGFTPAEIRCLADLAQGGRLNRFPTGYARYNALGEQIDRAHSIRVIGALEEKRLVRRWMLATTAGPVRWAVLTGGEAAWIARTAAKRAP